MSSIRVTALTKYFGDHAAVSDVSFFLPEGKTIALLGPSGCGKTTILRCLAGLKTPDEGSIELDGAPVFDAERDIDLPPEQRDLGIVFQSYAVWPHMTVEENVAFPLKVRGVKRAERRRRASEMLELVGLGGFEKRSATLVSGGQQQRIALARALVHEPRLVLFDEALSNLDTRLRQQMRMELRQLQERLRFTAIYVTHDQEEAFGLADDVILMNDGAIQAMGPARTLFHAPPSAFAARFFGMNVLEARITAPTAAGSVRTKAALSPDLSIEGRGTAITHFREGEAVLACIRKEAVRISRAPHPEDVTGIVAAASFLGSEEEYIVDIAGVRLNAIGPALGLAKGDPVRVEMSPEEWIFVK